MRSTCLKSLLRLSVLLAGAPLAASAMQMNTCDDQLLLSGDVERGDYYEIKKRLSAHPEIGVVVLRNSRGGDAESGYDVGEYFRDKGISTYLSGYCLSSCSRMFLGGKERFFTDDFPLGKSNVGFHSNYNNAGNIMPGAQWKLSHFIQQYSDGKADPALVERWVNIPNHNGFARFYHPTALHRRDGVSMLMCNGSEGNRQWELCEKISDHDALSMGIITSLDIKHSCDADAIHARESSSSSASNGSEPGQ